MVTKPDPVLTALRDFAEEVSSKFKANVHGAPEDQLRAPIENLVKAVGGALKKKIVAKGESRLPGQLGRPDYAVMVDGLLTGYIELKEPGKGADPDKYTGHDREQWKRFQSLPNIIYTDGNEWALYRDGQRVGSSVMLSGSVTTLGAKAVKPRDAAGLSSMHTVFLSWAPIVPKNTRDLAAMLAPLCRMLREDVSDALKDSKSPLVVLAEEWRTLLFPQADDARFADAYAQTVTFALLLARAEGADVGDLAKAIAKLSNDHALLSRALQVFTDSAAQVEIGAALKMLQRVVGRVAAKAFKRNGTSDPWLYFYEDFLAAYDPKLRRDAGAYYTPVEVVQAQVRLVDELLVDRLGWKHGFADDSVTTLDPAAGTGTYLAGIVDRVKECIVSAMGEGALGGALTQLAANLYGFEIMVGPYAVAELRVSRALVELGARLPEDGPGIFLTDTLESPRATPPHGTTLFQKPLADQHKRALQVKDKKPVLVCIGNPPYDRHEAADPSSAESRAKSGGWVRYDDPGDVPKPIFDDFTKPVIAAGHGGDLKNLYNLYIYFIRWALWKVFEQPGSNGPGVVSFITAASYLEGDAFAGVREHFRRFCDDVWIIDLGGDKRGPRKSENVFAIQTPVAIFVAVAYTKSDVAKPALVHYTAIEGTREEKLARLGSVANVSDLSWTECPSDWHAPFRPAGKGRYFDFPLITDLMPWRHSGVELKRTWPIAPSPEVLSERWETLLNSPNRQKVFRESGDRVVGSTYLPLPGFPREPAIADLGKSAPCPRVVAYGFRSLDRQWLIADSRLIARPRPELWRAHGDAQVYLTSLFNHPVSTGPVVTATHLVPDRHHYRGSYGGGDVLPMFRDAEAKQPNVAPELLGILSRALGREVSHAELVAYVYALLSYPGFAARYQDELATREIRVPLTSNADLFSRGFDVGAQLLWLHTFGERYFNRARKRGQLPSGAAKCARAVSDDPREYPEHAEYDADSEMLVIGTGVFGPVRPAVMSYEVSGMPVVESWLARRMKRGKGKKTSPLDDIRPQRWTNEFTTELLELLWVIDATIAMEPDQEKLLDAILAGPLINAKDLPPVPARSRKAPRETPPSLFDDEGDES